MSTSKPKIFIGSSSEIKDTAAQAFVNTLQSAATPLGWWTAPEFNGTQSTLDGLIAACNTYDFAIFILSPDDNLESRGQQYTSARDNVIFEFGLFLGTLGSSRVFAFLQEKDGTLKLKVPTDLMGIHFPRFSADDDHVLRSTVSTAVSTITSLIQRQGQKKLDVRLVSGWSFDPATKIFSMTISALRLEQHKAKIGENPTFIVVARVKKEDINPEDDQNIAIGDPRRKSKIEQDDLVVSVKNAAPLANAQVSDRIDGYLLLVPEQFSLSKVGTPITLQKILDAGCQIVEVKGITVKTLTAPATE